MDLIPPDPSVRSALAEQRRQQLSPRGPVSPQARPAVERTRPRRTGSPDGDRSLLARRADELWRLHVPGRPLLAPNVWDVVSARTFVAAGVPSIATSSGAIAATLGFDDGEQTPPTELFAAVSRIAAAVEVPLSADVEAGYRLDADHLVDELIAAGAAGCTIEDSDPATGALVERDRHARRLLAIREAAWSAGVPLVVNARIDVHLRSPAPPIKRFEDSLVRARVYIDAGADSVFPIGLADERVLESFVRAVGAPVTATYRPGESSVQRLADLGVARLSFGRSLHDRVVEELVRIGAAIAAGVDASESLTTAGAQLPES